VTRITHRNIRANGLNIHIAEAGEGPLVLLIHGFPELWYSWRHQLPALAEAGYHAVAPDVRGYGDSDAPQEIEAYTMRALAADAAGILDALGEDQAVIAGHDWGSPIAANSALLYPDRFRALAVLSVPVLPRPPVPPLQILDARFKDRFFYILYFQEPGVAEAEFEADVRRSMTLFIYAASGEGRSDPAYANVMLNKPREAKLFDGLPEPGGLPAWLTEEDLDYVTRAFQKTGFRGPLNRYRCMDIDWHDLAGLAGAALSQPALFIAGDRDPVLSFTPLDPMKTMVPNLKKAVLLPAAGHWIQQERPQEVNRELIHFLSSL
jgi:pimeloyl-ACP methyl ester carboxylesterase